MPAKLSRIDLLQSLFNTAIAYLDLIGDAERKKRIETERWRYIEICISSEPSELGLFKIVEEEESTHYTIDDNFIVLDSEERTTANTV